jgi:hypothetical protein
MIADKMLRGLFCKWCGRSLARSYLSTPGSVEKDESILCPVFCVCGGMTVVGGEIIERKIDREWRARERGRLAAKSKESASGER